MEEEIEKIKKESYEKEEEGRRLERKGKGMEEEIKEVRGLFLLFCVLFNSNPPSIRRLVNLSRSCRRPKKCSKLRPPISKPKSQVSKRP